MSSEDYNLPLPKGSLCWLLAPDGSPGMCNTNTDSNADANADANANANTNADANANVVISEDRNEVTATVVNAETPRKETNQKNNSVMKPGNWFWHSAPDGSPVIVDTPTSEDQTRTECSPHTTDEDRSMKPGCWFWHLAPDGSPVIVNAPTSKDQTRIECSPHATDEDRPRKRRNTAPSFWYWNLAPDGSPAIVDISTGTARRSHRQLSRKAGKRKERIHSYSTLRSLTRSTRAPSREETRDVAPRGSSTTTDTAATKMAGIIMQTAVRARTSRKNDGLDGTVDRSMRKQPRKTEKGMEFQIAQEQKRRNKRVSEFGTSSSVPSAKIDVLSHTTKPQIAEGNSILVPARETQVSKVRDDELSEKESNHTVTAPDVSKHRSPKPQISNIPITLMPSTRFPHRLRQDEIPVVPDRTHVTIGATSSTVTGKRKQVSTYPSPKELTTIAISRRVDTYKNVQSSPDQSRDQSSRTPSRDEMRAVFRMCRGNLWDSVLNSIRSNRLIPTMSISMDNHIFTTILHQAIRSRGDIQKRARVIQEVLRTNPLAASIQNGYGSLPLHTISQRNMKMDSKTREIMIRDLIDAFPESLTHQGGLGMRTPLHIILTDYTSPRLITTMIQHGSRACFLRDKNGFLPAHVACSRHCSPEKLEMLLRVNPASLLAGTNDGGTLLSLARTTATKAHPNHVLIRWIEKRVETALTAATSPSTAMCDIHVPASKNPGTTTSPSTAMCDINVPASKNPGTTTSPSTAMCDINVPASKNPGTTYWACYHGNTNICEL